MDEEHRWRRVADSTVRVLDRKMNAKEALELVQSAL
jgi:hypothetical protein